MTSNTSTTSTSRKRPNYLSWNDYFMATAVLAAKRSKDPVTQVGACIVNDDNGIVAVGYNGFPRHCSDDEFPWVKPTSSKSLASNGDSAKEQNDDDSLEDKGLYVVHAEANAILNKNTACLKGTRLYSTLFPCNECTKLIIQSGIREVLYMSDKYKSKIKYKASKRMFEAAGVRYTHYVPTQRKIYIDFEEFVDDKPMEQIRGDQKATINAGVSR